MTTSQEYSIRAVLKMEGISKAYWACPIYISHKMDEIFRISETITVLRDGRHIETRPASQFDGNTLVKIMGGIGEKIETLHIVGGGAKNELLNTAFKSRPDRRKQPRSAT